MATSQKSVEELTDKQLEAEWTKAAKELEDAKARCREFSQEHQVRAARTRLEQSLQTMSDADRRALVQMMSAEGIESSESVQAPEGKN